MPEDKATALEPTATMTGVIPHLSLYGRAGEAADFYVRAFGARELARMPDPENPDTLMHVHLEIHGGALMMTDCVAPGEAVQRPQGFNLQLVVPDGDAWWNRAVEAGCKVVMPFEKMFWGDRWGMVEDPFGISWAIDEPA